MVKVYIKVYGKYTINGKDFQQVKSGSMRRILFSPDNVHSFSVTEMKDGCLCLTNTSNIPFEFSLSRNGKLIALVKCDGVKQQLLVNTNWRITQNGVENKVYFKKSCIKIEKSFNVFFLIRKFTPTPIFSQRQTSTLTLI